MSTVYLFAVANMVVCGVIVFIALCRLNAMGDNVLFRVRVEYAAYVGGALASAAQPWWGEWPEWGTISLALAVVVAFVCQSSAWRSEGKDKPPESATGPAPLGAE